MPEFTLQARSPLDGQRAQYADITIEEITDRALVSIAVPLGGERALNKALKSTCGVQMPTVGKVTTSKQHDTSLLGTAADQCFMLFAHPGGQADDAVRAQLGDCAYLVDQSDAWVMLRISGNNCRAALERICPLDLDANVFVVGDVARTAMEHLGVIIVHEDENTYLLLSARSSAASFLHAVDTSARNVS